MTITSRMAVESRDFSLLEKGDYISPAECMEIINEGKPEDQWVEPDMKAYDIPMMTLKGTIEQELRRASKDFRVMRMKDGLKICTDIENSCVSLSRGNSNEKRLYLNHNHLSHVDTSGFTPEEKEHHNEGYRYSASRILAVRRNRKEYRLIEVKRNMPRADGSM